jgi:DNA-binding PadR family transcriptional regulator
MPPRGSQRRAATRDAVAQAGRSTKGRSPEPFTGELRRRQVLPLLVLHFISEGPCYGNQLMERISALTAGVLSINPNTMYPLLRDLEARGLIEGQWEHPDRRSRRYYSLTKAGTEEYERLVSETRPFLDSLARSIREMVREIYG